MSELFHPLNLASSLGYLDGGTGSMLLQAAMAAMLSAAFVLKTKWAQLKAVVGSRIRKQG